MKDLHIYQGFAENDQKVMSEFYNENYGRFSSYFRKKYGKGDEYVSDLYLDSYEALWNNIHTGKLTGENLTSSMYQYMLGIAIRMMMSGDRKNRELLKTNMFYGNNLNKAVVKKDQDAADHADDEERDAAIIDFVERAVSTLKPPCNELLRLFYWERMSQSKIAEKMNYSNADTISTLKHKCMGKIKPIVMKFRDMW